MSTGYNYYEILELNCNAAQHEVTTAYQRIKATYSGDNPAIYTIFTEKEAREFLVLIEEAYSVLGNKTLRGIYDQRLLGGRAADLSFESLINESKQMGLLKDKKENNKKPNYSVNEEFEKEIKSNQNWDGEFLKRVREYKNYSIETMSEITKIRSYYITAIEAMDNSNLPAQVFIRGYVIQIAKELGLDDKKVADSYMKILKEKMDGK